MILSPFFILICLLLRLTGEGEVLYRQERVGKGNKIFHLLKFATMLKNSPNIATGNITIKDDPRVLPIGKILRSTKINELPQLVNILLGDMSFVGRRPLTPDLYKKYSERAKLAFKHSRPGLTGVGSIIFRSEDHYLNSVENPIKFYESKILPYKEELELWYLENSNFKLYIVVIFITILVVLKLDFGIEKRFRSTVPAHKLFNSASL